MHIGLNEINLHASLGGQCTRFTLRRRRKIERNDIQPLLGEPHAVTALAVRDRERPAAPWQQFLTRFEKVIRLLAERIIGRREARFPARVFVNLAVD